MPAEMNTIKANIAQNLFRAEKQEGRNYLVAPVVLITEGVHNNVLYPAKELKRFPHAWNARPLPLRHPMKANQHVSACSPEIIEQHSVGQVFNVNFEQANSDHPARLVGEAWIDTGKLKALIDGGNEQAVAAAGAIESDDVIEVSTGLYTDDILEKGKFNGKPYTAIATNHRPDHLAILATEKGACSGKDGCGIRANSEEDEAPEVSETVTEKIMSKLNALASAMWLRTNELTNDDRRQTLDLALRQKLMLKPGQWFRVTDFTDSYVVYEFTDDGNREEGRKESETKLMKRGYTVDENDALTLEDEAVQVARRTEYIPQAPQTPQVITTNAGQNQGNAMTKESKVQAVIAAEGNEFAAGDEATLMKLNEAQLDGFLVEAPKANCQCKGEAPKANATPLTKEDVTAIVAEVIKGSVPALITNAVKEATGKAEAAPVLERLKANESCKLSDEALEGMGVEALTQLEQSITPSLYDGKGAIRTNAGSESQIPATPSIYGQPAAEQKGA